MAEVTVYDAVRMKEIEDNTVVNGEIDPVTGHLMLTRFDATEIDAGLVVTSPKVVTSGTRPTGGALFDGLLIYETDTKKFYSYNGTAWVALPPGVILCTSATRPASPYTGMYIFETDTKRTYVYDSTWKHVSNTTREEVDQQEFVPAANRDSTSATTVNWTTETVSVTVPPWATKAIVTSHVVGMYCVTADANAAVRTSLNGVDGTYENSISLVLGIRAALSWVDQFTGLTAGAKVLRPRIRRSSGTGTIRADASTHFSYMIDFKP